MASTLEQRMEEIERLVARLEACPDPDVQAAAREMVGALLALHAAGFARVLEWLDQAGDCGQTVLARCAEDELVAHLLMLHGLHPEGIESRVRRALDTVRPYLNSHGGGVELLEIGDGTVRLRLQGSCKGCPSSQATLAQTVEKAIYEAAPDVMRIEVEGAAERAGPSPLVQLAVS